MTYITVTINNKKQMLDFLPCPYCGSKNLSQTDWWDDDGEYNAIACLECKAEAPAATWNKRS